MLFYVLLVWLGPVTFFALFGLAIWGLVAWLTRKGKRKPGPPALPYQKRKYFFSRAEQRFYSHLVRAVGNVRPDLTVFSKVRMADLLLMAKGTTGRAYWSAWGRISQKHVDFIVLAPIRDAEEPGALEPVLVVELDDSSHQREDRQQRDTLVDAIYAQVGLPILHIPVAHTYNVGDLTARIRQVLPPMRMTKAQAGPAGSRS